MNLYEYGEYAEWGKPLNGISLCEYLLNIRNESVLILRICVFNFSHTGNTRNEYTENMQNAWKVKSLGEFETKNENILGNISGT